MKILKRITNHLISLAVRSQPARLREKLKLTIAEADWASNKKANLETLEKAESFIERYREIVSDPINLLIRRNPTSGYIDDDGRVVLHNGNRVPLAGDLAYYGGFSDILVINRGVHEPLEEYCFQQTISNIKENPEPLTMIELGAYWAHYSMWFLQKFPNAECFMVEPEERNIAVGKNNFLINNFKGDFIKDFVGNSGFKLDSFVSKRQLSKITILHSDIQGYEMEMLDGAKDCLKEHLVDYIFISTHSEILHEGVVNQLSDFGYRIEVSSNFAEHTTSCDGFVMASSPEVNPTFKSFAPLGRLDIAKSSPRALVDYLASTSLAN